MVILIVDEDVGELKEMKEYLLSAYPNSDVYAFSDSQQAYEFSISHTIDICFTEIKMSKVSGFTISNVIKNHKNFSKVIFLADDNHFALDAWKMYINGYIVRPLSKEKVNQVIKA